MKKIQHPLMALLLLATALSVACSADRTETVSSPDGNIEIKFCLTPQGEPTYSATYKDRPIVANSLMGFEIKDAEPLTGGFRMDGVNSSETHETWAPVWGENDSIVNNYRQMAVNLSRGDLKMNIEFRVYDDGFGFRYLFPEQPAKQYVVTDEMTQFAMAGDHTAWWIRLRYSGIRIYPFAAQ